MGGSDRLGSWECSGMPASSKNADTKRSFLVEFPYEKNLFLSTGFFIFTLFGVFESPGVFAQKN